MTAARATLVEPTRGYPSPPLSRSALVWRYAVGSSPVLMTLMTLVAAAPLPATVTDSLPALWLRIVDLALFPVGVFVIRLRRQHPLAVAVVLSILVSASTASFGLWSWAIISMATRRRWRWVAAAASATVLAALVVTPVITATSPLTVRTPDDAPLPELAQFALFGVTITLFYLFLVAWGFYIGARHDLIASLTERAETAEREQTWRIAEAQAGERARIAREMHDVLAHRISLVSMNAGILAFRDDLSADQTRDIARVIETNAAASLVELRSVLGTLREPGATPAKPQPSLADLPELVAQARTAGASITFDQSVEAADTLPPTIGRHAYRIIQEALTNARKHAVGAPVRVSVSGRPGDGLVIEVSNPLTTSSGMGGAGLGLVGLAERAQIAGGHCEAGARNGTYVVKAWLPWQT